MVKQVRSRQDQTQLRHTGCRQPEDPSLGVLDGAEQPLLTRVTSHSDDRFVGLCPTAVSSPVL